MAQLFREFLQEMTLRDQTKHGPAFSFEKKYGKWYVIDDNTYDDVGYQKKQCLQSYGLSLFHIEKLETT